MTTLFDFLNPHRCPTGVNVSDAALSRRDAKVARLYEQGASKKRIARTLVRWLGWVVAAGTPMTSHCEVVLNSSNNCSVSINPNVNQDVVMSIGVIDNSFNGYPRVREAYPNGIGPGCEIVLRKKAYVINRTVNDGAIICNPAKPESGETTTCYAIPDAGYTHGVWGGDCGTGTNRTICTLTNVSADKTISASFVLDRPVVQIVMDPTTPTTLYSALDGGGVYKKTASTDWTAATTQPSNLKVKALAIAASGTTLYAGTDGGGVFKSTDSGVNWAACANTELTNLNLRSLSLAGTTLYAGTTAGVFKSTDGCANWSAMNAGLPL